MGSTPRQHRYQLPMATRSTDVAELGKCPGSWVLKHFYEEEQTPATYFELGSALHEGIECSVREDLDLDQALALVTGRIEDWMDGADGPVLESSKRGMDTMLDDAGRMMRQWFDTVHPDSPKRLGIYDDYEWPPRVEHPFMRTDHRLRYPVWGSIDAAFGVKGGQGIAIVDWKSSTSRQKNSDQLHFYQFGLGMGDAAMSAWFHNLDRKQERAIIQMADPYPGDGVVARRIRAAEDIKLSILEKKRVKFEPSVLCNYCPVQQFCPQEGRDRAANLTSLRRMLDLARPLEDMRLIERVA